MKSWLCVFLGGGLGAMLRYAVVRLTVAWFSSNAFPWSIFIINISGSLVLGFLMGIATPLSISQPWWLFTATGVLGGYTTFSTWSGNTFSLLNEGHIALAAWNVFGSGVAGVIAAAAGWMLARTILR